jgi:exosortase A-associated hydrolase 2
MHQNKNTSKYLTGKYISSSGSNILLVQHGQISDTAILFLPSFGEELNLSRAVVTKQAHYFAQQGLATICVDYRGTGDSELEFDQVTCDDWLQDIISAGQWMQQQGVKRIVLWGIRFGSLLGMANQQTLLSSLPIFAQIHWKPVTNGKQFASQFLRIKQANNMMTKGAEKTNWREHIMAGNPVEVAGYSLTSDMLQSLDKLILSTDFKPATPFAWMELGATKITPAIARYTDNWDEERFRILLTDTTAFWQIPEVFDLPELYPASLASLEQMKVV